MAFPAVNQAVDVQWASIATQSASFTAANGSINLVTTGSSAITCTLPPVAQGGPVVVKKMDSGTGAVTIKSNEGAGVLVDGIAGNTGRAQAATQYLSWTFVSDGVSNWYQVF